MRTAPVRRRRFGAAVPLLLISALATRAFAATYYVDPDSGSDSNNGTSSATPVKTLAKARQLPYAGDSLLFRAGTTSTGTLWFTHSGTLSQPITIGKYGEGSLPLLAGNGASTVINLDNTSYVTLQDLEISNCKTLDWVQSSNVVRSGITGSSSKGGAVKGVLLQRLYVHDVGAWPQSNDPDDLWYMGWGVAFDAKRQDPTNSATMSWFDGLTVQNCFFANVVKGLRIADWGDRGRDSSGKLLVPNRNVVFRNNVFFRSASTSMFLCTTDGALVENNEFYGTGNVTSGLDVFFHTSDNGIIRHNRLDWGRNNARNDEGNAIDIDIDCHNILITENVSRSHRNGFMLICSLRDTVDKGPSEGFTENITVCNNLSLDDNYGGASQRTLILVSAIRSITFSNNVFSWTVDKDHRLVQCANWMDTNWPRNITFQNNIFTCGTNNQLRIDPGSAQLVFSNNLWDAGNYPTPVATPDVGNACVGSPRFTNEPIYATWDSATPASSPARTAGFNPFSLFAVVGVAGAEFPFWNERSWVQRQFPSRALDTPFDPAASFDLVNCASGQLLEVAGGSASPGAPLDQRPCANLDCQRWTLADLGNGSYRLANLHSGLLLTAPSTNPGVLLQQDSYAGSPNQQWRVVPVGSCYKLMNASNTLAAEIIGAPTASGPAVDQSPYAGLMRQQWQICRSTVADPTPLTLSNGLASLRFYRLPGYTYVLERATNPAGAPWIGIATNRAATNGVVAVQDSRMSGAPGAAYYRWRWQP